jgi:ribonuclease HI
MNQGTIKKIISDARTVVFRHGHGVGPAPIGYRRIYEDPRLRIAICDQAGVDDCFISIPAFDETRWQSVLVWSTYGAQLQSPMLFQPGVWTHYLKYIAFCHSRALLDWRVAHWRDSNAALWSYPQEIRCRHIEKVRSVAEQELYVATDGCWLPDARRGGWAFLLRYGSVERIGFGCAEHTNNEQMELLGILEGLRCLERLGLLAERRRITVVTDDEMVARLFTGFSHSRPRQGWAQARKPVRNAAVLDEIYELVKEHTACWLWVGGQHVADNSRVHELCRLAAGLCTPEAREAAGLTMEEWNEYWGDISIPSHSPTSKT